MVDSLQDYGFNKSADATSLNSASLTDFPAYVELESGTDSTGTGVGVLDSSASINGKEDIGFFDENGNPLDYYWVTFDTTNDVYEAWVLTDIVRDGGTELKVGYGSGSTDDSSTETNTWDSSIVDYRWSMDETGSTITESTSSSYDGSISGSPTQGVNGVFGSNAIDMEGNGHVVTNAFASDLNMGGGNSKTHLAMVKMNSQGNTSGGITAHGTNSENEDYSLRDLNSTTGNNFRVQIWGSGDIDFFKNVTGVWTAISLNYDGSTLRAVFDGSTEASGSRNLNTGDSYPLYIGSWENQGSNNNIDAVIDEVWLLEQDVSNEFNQTYKEMSSAGNYSLFSWNPSSSTATSVTATPALGQATPLTAQTTGILGNWRAFKDARITERTQVKVEGGHAQKWEIDASKTTDERAVYRADQTLDLDLSTALDTASGGFTQGTIGWHIRIDDTAILRSTDALQLRVGSSPGDYAVWTLDRSELGPNGEYKYLTFSHDEYDSIVGTPDWTNADFFELTLFETSGNTTDTFIYVDYLTVSDRDDVGATGIGDRRSDKEQIRSGD